MLDPPRQRASLAPALSLAALALASGCSDGEPSAVRVHDAIPGFAVYEMTFGACPVNGVAILDARHVEPPDRGSSEGAAAEWGFHLIVPHEWLDWTVEHFILAEGPTNAAAARDAGQQLLAPLVLEGEFPEPLEAFDHYGDGFEPALVRLFVRRAPEADGRHEVYVSGH
ncbi:hypothetical protein Pla163_06010 [Planctomycetes bacterium Pla163]|uniref:Uncharacterized protein n=1 Tax=Rohdeia mirabilis TaxID=2528008 RepID=A0A518CW94_9BACT|nr:hypothetical protein Pla163_06010 [Planctomycetes bacterium Pla163]